MKIMKLSPRLMAAAGFIEPGAKVADIGTDHGRIPVYLALNGLAQRIIASDIKEGPLDSARRTALEYDVFDKITFVLAPGLSGINSGDCDTLVIAGMGGETITEILSAAPWTKNPGIKLILQPQSKTDELCAWLRGNGYALQDAVLAQEGVRIYLIVLAGAGFGSQCGVPALLQRNHDPLLGQYIDGLITKTRRAMEGLSRSDKTGAEYLRMADKLERLMKYI